VPVAVFYAFDRYLDIGNYYAMLSDLLLVISVIKYPEGFIGPLHAASHTLRRLLRQRLPGRVTAASAPESGQAPAVVEPPAIRETGEGVMLSVSDLIIRYGGVAALDSVSYEIRAGEIVGLIGPNGAGKTTCVDAISGFVKSTGAVQLRGRSIDGLEPHQRSRAGLGRTFQGIELYEDLSVRENVEVGSVATARTATGPGTRSRRAPDSAAPRCSR
jgi:ABC-type glutathione transport system ATPase component